MPFTIKMFKKMFLQKSLPSRLFSVITFVIVLTISETICGTANILLKASLTWPKLYQIFVVTVKAMVNFIWYMGHCAGKCFCFRYIETYLTPVTLAFTRSCFFLSLSVSLCLSVSLSVCLSVCLSISLSVSISLPPSLPPSLKLNLEITWVWNRKNLISRSSYRIV